MSCAIFVHLVLLIFSRWYLHGSLDGKLKNYPVNRNKSIEILLETMRWFCLKQTPNLNFFKCKNLNFHCSTPFRRFFGLSKKYDSDLKFKWHYHLIALHHCLQSKYFKKPLKIYNSLSCDTSFQLQHTVRIDHIYAFLRLPFNTNTHSSSKLCTLYRTQYGAYVQAMHCTPFQE